MTAVLLILDMVRYLMADPSLLTVPHVIMNIILNILLAVFTVWGVYRVRMLQPKNSSQKPEVRS
jgi:hypothetical protein